MLLELLGKGGLVCLAIGQIEQWISILSLWFKFKSFMCFIAERVKCPNLLCHKRVVEDPERIWTFLLIEVLENSVHSRLKRQTESLFGHFDLEELDLRLECNEMGTKDF